MKRTILYGGLIVISLLTFMFIITSTLIGFDVNQRCDFAIERYGGDCVEALSAQLDDKDNSYRTKNSSIWALGQYGDERALPILEKYYTGEIPEREPYDEGISQYELKKAINLCRGGFNITKLVRENFSF